MSNYNKWSMAVKMLQLKFKEVEKEMYQFIRECPDENVDTFLYTLWVINDLIAMFNGDMMYLPEDHHFSSSFMDCKHGVQVGRFCVDSGIYSACGD